MCVANEVQCRLDFECCGRHELPHRETGAVGLWSFAVHTRCHMPFWETLISVTAGGGGLPQFSYATAPPLLWMAGFGPPSDDHGTVHMLGLTTTGGRGLPPLDLWFQISQWEKMNCSKENIDSVSFLVHKPLGSRPPPSSLLMPPPPHCWRPIVGTHFLSAPAPAPPSPGVPPLWLMTSPCALSPVSHTHTHTHMHALVH